jgi:hypothetical protein
MNDANVLAAICRDGIEAFVITARVCAHAGWWDRVAYWIAEARRVRAKLWAMRDFGI